MEGQPGTRSPAYTLVYASCLPQLKEVAREHGYALAVHGSMKRDLDLVAIPWVENASSAVELAEAIRDAVNGQFREVVGARSPEWKPHGRLAWSIYMRPEGGSPYIDLSVMPRRRAGEHYDNEDPRAQVRLPIFGS